MFTPKSTRCYSWIDLVDPIVSSMKGNMVIDTLANGLVITSLVFLNCPLSICSKYFRVDLICLPLSQLYVILGLIWLEFNHVHMNYFDKTVLFSELGKSKYLKFIYANQVELSLK